MGEGSSVTLDDVLAADAWAREKTLAFCSGVVPENHYADVHASVLLSNARAFSHQAKEFCRVA